MFVTRLLLMSYDKIRQNKKTYRQKGFGPPALWGPAHCSSATGRVEYHVDFVTEINYPTQFYFPPVYNFYVYSDSLSGNVLSIVFIIKNTKLLGFVVEYERLTKATKCTFYDFD